MHATKGDRLHRHGRTVGDRDTYAEIVEVLGVNGEPPYRVRFDDGREGIVSPGSDAVVETVEGEVRT